MFNENFSKEYPGPSKKEYADARQKARRNLELQKNREAVIETLYQRNYPLYVKNLYSSYFAIVGGVGAIISAYQLLKVRREIREFKKRLIHFKHLKNIILNLLFS